MVTDEDYMLLQHQLLRVSNNLNATAEKLLELAQVVLKQDVRLKNLESKLN
jgi:hypothetical protein